MHRGHERREVSQNGKGNGWRDGFCRRRQASRGNHGTHHEIWRTQDREIVFSAANSIPCRSPHHQRSLRSRCCSGWPPPYKACAGVIASEAQSETGPTILSPSEAVECPPSLSPPSAPLLAHSWAHSLSCHQSIWILLLQKPSIGRTATKTATRP